MGSVELGEVVAYTLAGLPLAGVVSGAGSRNAPLSMAFFRLDAAGRLPLHVAIDERSGAFRALGMAKATRKLGVVAVTSGSAVANLLPAIVEAKHAGIPLLVLTADRPMEVVGTGASQTTNQVGIYGDAVLASLRLSSSSGTPAAWSAMVQRAAHLALGTRSRQPGPVQLNLEFRPPLVGPSSSPEIRFTQVMASVESGICALSDGPRTVVMAGDASPEQGATARAFAEAARLPLLAEPTSNARAGECAIVNYRRILIDPLGKEIERVVLFGHPTLSRPQLELLGSVAHLVVVSEFSSWHDIGHRAELVADRVSLVKQDEQWLQRWLSADRMFGPEERWCGRVVADTVLRQLGPGDNLVLGASSLIRDADLAPIHPNPPRLYASRGQAGIDGTIGLATGIALASARPTTVLLGDLSAQHDLGSLVRPPSEPLAQLRVVVGDDNGGSLFHRLEQGRAEYSAAFERVFGTPQQLDLVKVAQGFGWKTALAGDASELEEALAGDAEFIVARYPRARAHHPNQ